MAGTCITKEAKHFTNRIFIMAYDNSTIQTIAVQNIESWRRPIVVAWLVIPIVSLMQVKLLIYD